MSSDFAGASAAASSYSPGYLSYSLGCGGDQRDLCGRSPERTSECDLQFHPQLARGLGVDSERASWICHGELNL